jgi:hypothetical protein
MDLKAPLPKPVSWITRTIGYSVGAVAIGIAWLVAGNLRLGHHFIACMETQSRPGDPRPTAMENAKKLVACVDARSGIVEFLAFRNTKKLFSALPSAPCHYVGTWQAARENSLYRITLDADGQFRAEPIRTPDRDATTVTGSWAVIGRRDSEKMVWLYDEGRVWPPDINPVKNARADGFTLTEENGSSTEYSLTQGGKCGA